MLWSPTLPADRSSLTTARKHSCRSPIDTTLVFWRSLRLIAPGPLGKDAFAVVRHLLKIDLGHACLRIHGIVLWRVLHLRMRHHGIVSRIELIGGLGHGPVGNLPGKVGFRAALDNGKGLHIPADTLKRRDDLDRRTRRLLSCSPHVQGDASNALALGRLYARCAARMRVNRNVLVQRVHVFPGFGFAHQLDPRGNREITRSRRGRVWHYKLVLEFACREVGPRLRRLEASLLSLDCVEADDTQEGILSN